ncbi:DUF1064 domain-containing protein [Anaerobacillus sp. MEB173]|uniref:DUF1064 domain-containing protein n=1 Tax=Anaerobacillus sp. MEB173 TaxID=3383345 RepID=UPI003F917FFC
MSAVKYRSKKNAKHSKYKNRKVELDGYKFDSIMESQYYKQLVWLKKARQIKGFILQPRFVLQEAFEKDGVKFKKIEYVADFEIHNLDGTTEIIDVKGVETKEFLLKKKLFHAKYPHKLTVVTNDSTYGWIELDRLKTLEKSNKRR